MHDQFAHKFAAARGKKKGASIGTSRRARAPIQCINCCMEQLTFHFGAAWPAGAHLSRLFFSPGLPTDAMTDNILKAVNPASAACRWPWTTNCEGCQPDCRKGDERWQPARDPGLSGYRPQCVPGQHATRVPPVVPTQTDSGHFLPSL
jgi:hypothetical protein